MISPALMVTFTYLVLGMITAAYMQTNDRIKQSRTHLFEMEGLPKEFFKIYLIAAIIVDVLLWPIMISDMMK